ncbi:MAG: ABC transporter permease [Spirochaetia bacterium]|nr:ABC transporter permease [Spirochaetia bacterium]
MYRLFAVIRREFKAAAANRTFVIMTILGPCFLLAITLLPGLLAGNPDVLRTGKPVAINAADAATGRFLTEALSSQHMELTIEDDPRRGRDLVYAGSYGGYIEVPAAWPDEEARYFTRTGTEVMVFSSVEAILSSYATQLRISEAGLSQEQASVLLSEPAFRVIRLGTAQKEETATQDDFMSILMTALSFVMLIYMTVLLYGQMIGRSVVQEKSGKTVEIMLSSLSSRDLMFGKILGLGLASLLQYTFWISMGIFMITLVGPAFDLRLPAALSIDNLFWLLLFFLLAFFLYAAAYAFLGAAAKDEHHLGQLSWPLIIFLIIPMVLISTLVMNPESPVVRFLSFFPFTSPIVMLIRVLAGAPAWWELGLCIGLLIMSIYAVTILGARLFRTGILMSGKRYSIREIMRWIRVR